MVSICIAVFNGEKYIKEQLASIICQINSNDEIIVSDNYSTDNTINIINEFNDPRIKIFYCPKSNNIPIINQITLNFENALKYAKGDIIFLSDQDDVWLPNKVELTLTALQKYDYVVSDCYITDSNLIVKSSSRFINSSIKKNKFLALFFPTPYQGSCAAFNRKILDMALPFPKCLQSHDRWIGYVSSFFFNYKILDDSLIYYRRHNLNSSSFDEISKNTLKYKIFTRLYYITNLIYLFIIIKYKKFKTLIISKTN